MKTSLEFEDARVYEKIRKAIGWPPHGLPPQQSQPFWGCQGFREFQVEFLPNFGENRKEYSQPHPSSKKKKQLCSQLYSKAREMWL